MEIFKSAVILAGGKSSRMKFDKQTLSINKERLIYKIAENLENHFEEIIIISNKKSYYRECKYKIVGDDIKDMGPLGGISKGLDVSSSKFVYIIACDMPYINDEYIKKLKNMIESDIKKDKTYSLYISCIDNKIQPFQGFYNKYLSIDIKKHLSNNKNKSINSFLEKNHDKIKYIKDVVDKNVFINLNTQDELRIYKEL